jgi:hypothetical protein
MTPEVRDAVDRRLDERRPYYDLSHPDRQDAFQELVLHSVRLEQCRSQEKKLRLWEMQRAEHRWDDDRRAEAEELAKGLTKRPELVASRLGRTKHGAEWLIAKWRVLGGVLERKGDWTREEELQAHDLLGTPLGDLRQDVPLPAPADLPALVAREIERLEGLKARSLDRLDEMEREEAEAGTPIEPSAAMRRLRRYESSCRRTYQQAAALLRPYQVTPPVQAPAPVAAPEPEPAAPETKRTQCDPGQAASTAPAVAAPAAESRPRDLGTMLLANGQIAHSPRVWPGLPDA